MGSGWGEIRTVFGEEFRRTTHRIAFRLMTLAVPAILLVLLIAVPLVRDLTSGDDEGEAEAGRIGLLDLSGELLTEAPTEEVIRGFPDREAGVAALRSPMTSNPSSSFPGTMLRVGAQNGSAPARWSPRAFPLRMTQGCSSRGSGRHW